MFTMSPFRRVTNDLPSLALYPSIGRGANLPENPEWCNGTSRLLPLVNQKL